MKCTSKLEGFRLLPTHDPRTLECTLEEAHDGYCWDGDVQYWPSSPLKVFVRKGRAYAMFPNESIGIRLHGGFCRSAKNGSNCMLRWRHRGIHQAKGKVWVDEESRKDSKRVE